MEEAGHVQSLQQVPNPAILVLQVPTLFLLASLPSQQRLLGPEPPAHSSGSSWLLALLLYNMGLISLRLH